jgi:uncharacterized protein (TIGR02246 family)
MTLPISLPPDDAAAIEELLTRVGQGFATLDAGLVASAYSDRADWTNAFGQYRQGRDQIREYLARVFQTEAFRAGQQAGPPEVSVRLIRPDVAVARLRSERVEQRTVVSGRTIPRRRIHQMMVLAKTDGRWLIEAELVMDEEAE